MELAKLTVNNFRGIKHAEVSFAGNAVLVGDNNVGKSTILEAIDLVLGPERLRGMAIDEHDFYAGQYIGNADSPIAITSEAILTGLSEEQVRHFHNHVEWWDIKERCLLDGPPAERTDADGVVRALRVVFEGTYDSEEDDFAGNTYFGSPVGESGEREYFRSHDKRLCGFLFLRTLRTGSRALSLERGSLLDIILRLQDTRLKMWENVLTQLRALQIATEAEGGLSDTLSAVQNSIHCFVPSEWADKPRMRVSDLTRESLRKILTVFMETGAQCSDDSVYAAPFQHQGTGTINTLVLSLLSEIAKLKQNVIFAMEEPEIAVPPCTQKRIVDAMKRQCAQVLFTSHSPYVLEEFASSNILVAQRTQGTLTCKPAGLPPAVKPKEYRAEVRMRLCEAVLARRILIVEGQTEYEAVPAAARRLHELVPDTYSSLEALGIAVVNARTDSQVAPLGEYYQKLGKTVYAMVDKQEADALTRIREVIPTVFESPTKGFEDLLVTQTADSALRRYGEALVADGEWPQHLAKCTPRPETGIGEVREALRAYLKWGKGCGSAADLVCQCGTDEMPEYIITRVKEIQSLVMPPTPPAAREETSTDASAPA